MKPAATPEPLDVIFFDIGGTLGTALSQEWGSSDSDGGAYHEPWLRFRIAVIVFREGVAGHRNGVSNANLRLTHV